MQCDISHSFPFLSFFLLYPFPFVLLPYSDALCLTNGSIAILPLSFLHHRLHPPAATHPHFRMSQCKKRRCSPYWKACSRYDSWRIDPHLAILHRNTHKNTINRSIDGPSIWCRSTCLHLRLQESSSWNTLHPHVGPPFYPPFPKYSTSVLTYSPQSIPRMQSFHSNTELLK
jgi:hypothetical protein